MYQYNISFFISISKLILNISLTQLVFYFEMNMKVALLLSDCCYQNVSMHKCFFNNVSTVLCCKVTILLLIKKVKN